MFNTRSGKAEITKDKISDIFEIHLLKGHFHRTAFSTDFH